MYLNKNIKTFNRGAFINSYKIENLYYPGSYDDFNKIYFEPGCAKRPILENVGKLFVMNKEGKYYQVIFDRTTMAEARVLSKELIDACLTRDATLMKAACKKSLKDHPDGEKVFVRYYENQLKVIAETSFFNLKDDFKEYLLDNKVSLLMDDLIINYAITKDTKINMVRAKPFYSPIKSHYGDLVIKNNAIVGFELDKKEYQEWELEFPQIAVSVGKEIASIEKDAFKGINGVLINYDGDIKDYLKIDVKEDFTSKGVVVRCLDGTLEYVKVNHLQRETRDLYYGYAHMGNNYRYSMQFAINSKKMWEFLKLSHEAIIAWQNFCGTPYTVFSDDDVEYCILDYHNFKMIACCDVEAG